MLKDCNTGAIVTFNRTEPDKLFGHTCILNILAKLAGRVEGPIIQGDIRLGYINELTEATSGGAPIARTVQGERQYSET